MRELMVETCKRNESSEVQPEGGYISHHHHHHHHHHNQQQQLLQLGPRQILRRVSKGWHSAVGQLQASFWLKKGPMCHMSWCGFRSLAPGQRELTAHVNCIKGHCSPMAVGLAPKPFPSKSQKKQQMGTKLPTGQWQWHHRKFTNKCRAFARQCCLQTREPVQPASTTMPLRAETSKLAPEPPLEFSSISV